jgi:Fe2+ transport system protein FeoA
MLFSGTLTGYLSRDGLTVECEGFVDATVKDLCRRFVMLGFAPETKLVVKRRQGQAEIEVATIKLNDPLRSNDFDLNNLGAGEAVDGKQ